MHFLARVFVLILLAGCGSKGALYLPEKPASEEPAATQQSEGNEDDSVTEEEDE
jgi:predicted small lipoprotein YifL